MQNKTGDLTVVSVTPETSPASDAANDLVKDLRATAGQIPRSERISAYVTDQTAVNIDTADRLAAALPRYVMVVVGLALILLMVVFRSILVPLKPPPASCSASPPRWGSSSGSSRTATSPGCSMWRTRVRS
jgi:uncharacterized membrane protein YdfJ with MMPL/SSD domain